jgi:hypothetical protein
MHLSVKRNNSQRNPDFAGAAGFIRWHPNPLPDTLLHHFVWTLDGVGDTARFYFDGEEQDIFVRYAPNPPNKVYTGMQIQGHVGIAGPLFGNSFDLMEGIVDEYRVFEGILSPEWVRTEWNNQSSPTTFFNQSDEEQQVVGIGTPSADLISPVPIRIHPNPFRVETSIELESLDVELEVAIFDISGRMVRMLSPSQRQHQSIRLRWDGREEDGRSLAAGIYFVRARAGLRSSAAKIILIR